MAETSRSQVTITLGRSGQVVKRAGPVSDNVFSDSHPAVGSKRSVRDRLGSNVDSTQLNKRQRGDNNRLGISAVNGVDDMHLGKDDLRYKIMRKSVLNRTQNDGQQNGVDLREILSRPAQPSTNSHGMPQHTPEPRDVRQRMPEPRDVRQRMPEPRDVRQRMPDSKDVRQRMPEPRDVRQRMPEPRDVRQHMPEPKNGRHHMPEPRDFRQHMPEPNNAGAIGRIPSTRNADALPQMDSLRNSYSPWTLDRLRRRSPDGALGSSRGLSPPRNEGKLQRRPLMRPYDDVRAVPYMSKDVLELSRPMRTASFMTKPAIPAGPAKPVMSLLAPPPPLPGGGVQKSSYMVDGQHTVDSLLHSLGLEKYAINFKAEEVDIHALMQMGDHDLKELGIPMGPRKKILLALLPRSRRQV